MAEFREDYWEELERLEGERQAAQARHDEAMQALFASRDANGIAPPEAFDEYHEHMEAFDEKIKALQDFQKKYTPYQ